MLEMAEYLVTAATVIVLFGAVSCFALVARTHGAKVQTRTRALVAVGDGPARAHRGRGVLGSREAQLPRLVGRGVPDHRRRAADGLHRGADELHGPRPVLQPARVRDRLLVGHPAGQPLLRSALPDPADLTDRAARRGRDAGLRDVAGHQRQALDPGPAEQPDADPARPTSPSSPTVRRASASGPRCCTCCTRSSSG